MLKCGELDTIGMAFNFREITTHNYTKPRDLDNFLDHFHFRPMLEHKGVKNVHLEGVYPRFGEGNSLKCLEKFGKWLVKGFKEQGRDVNVYINKRRKIFERRTVGTKVVLEEGKKE
jgi:hypothetical protein